MKKVILGVALITLSGCGGYATPKKIDTAKKACKNRGGYASIHINLFNSNIDIECNDDSNLVLDKSNQIRIS